MTYQKGSSDEWSSIKSDYSGAVVIPETVIYKDKTYNVARISDYAFYKCSGLTSITIPSSVISIGIGAFRDCNNLQKVIVPDIAAWYGISFRNSDSNPLSYAHHLYNSETTEIIDIVIPDSVTSIGNYTFYGCSSLTSVSIPNSVTSIGNYAFRDCCSLTSVTIPGNVMTIGESAFYGCDNLTSVTLESDAIVSASKISSIFGDQVQNFIIGDAVTSIGSFSFYGCSELTSITIGSGVKSIGWCAFLNCNALKKVIVPDITAWLGITYTTIDSNPLRIAHHIFSDEDTEIKNLVIPDNVTSIGSGAFYGCSGLTSVTIPNSVTSIGSSAFSGCSGLTSVTIPNSVTSIDSYTFDGCSGLTSISIPNSVTSIGSGAFSGCSGLTSISIPNSVTSIGSGAFSGCSGLTSITIPNSVTSIGDNAFHNCSSLTSVTIPESVTEIGNSAFDGCVNLTSVTLDCNAVVSVTRKSDTSMKSIFGDQVQKYIIGNTVTNIGAYTFYNCSGLTSITIPKSVTRIGNYTFSGCNALKKVIVSDIAAWCNISFSLSSSNPLNYAHHIFSDEETEITDLVISDGVTGIKDNVFIGGSYLTSVIIPSSVTSIGYQTFYGCQGLTSIVLPEAITSIGSCAFYNCSGLTSITIPESITSIGSSAFKECTNLTNVTLGCNAIVSATRTSDTSMKSIFGDQVQTYIIDDAVTGIGDFAFSGCDSLSSVTISGGVTNIAKKAFDNCTSLTKVIVPDVAAWCGITFYDANANPLRYAHHIFSDEETEITDLVIPEGVTSIKFASFYYCTGLTSVTIPNSVTSIGKTAFAECSSIKNIDISENVKNIGDYAFNNCSALTSVIIPEDVTSIGDKAFYNCESISSIIIPYSVTSIGNSAFMGNTNLTSVVLNSNTIVSASRTASTSMKSIFGDQVQNYIIGDSVTSIGRSAFMNCSNMETIIVPECVTSIGSDAFSGTKWYDNLPDGLVYAGKVAYKYKGIMPGRTQITIKDGTLGIAGTAFSGCSGLTSVIIPSSVTTIDDSAFYGCTGLDSVILNSNAIVSASSSSSSSMKNIFGNQVKEYIIGDDVTSIGNCAFYDCSSLTSITIPNSVTSIGSNAFNGCGNISFYVNRASYALFYVWNNYNSAPYEIGTSELLARPALSVTSTTQTTITYEINNIYPELEYSCNYDETVGENEYLIKGLRPECQQTISLTVNSANNAYNTSKVATTSPISPTVTSKSITASSISVEGSYTEGDANVISQSLIINGEETGENEGRLYGLEPNKSYLFECKVTVEDDSGATYSYTGSKYIYTAALILTPLQPKVISAGNVIVSAQSNLDDEETNVGFEWRRTDWPDDFASNSGAAYLYEGTMEGYIRNLYTGAFWRYRPYYESNSGSRYYGNWVGIDPTNTSYFEPTVHTYATITVTGNRAEVKGYAMRGTDNVVSQGFMYWPSGTSVSLQRRAASVPSGATVVNASGNVMTATLEDLEYETTYKYVAFVTTSEGETFYGEMQTFSTSVDPDGIEEVYSSESIVHSSEEAVYDLSGRQIVNSKSSNSKLPRGINIIRMSDGTTKKVLVK